MLKNDCACWTSAPNGTHPLSLLCQAFQQRPWFLIAQLFFLFLLCFTSIASASDSADRRSPRLGLNMFQDVALKVQFSAIQVLSTSLPLTCNNLKPYATKHWRLETQTLHLHVRPQAARAINVMKSKRRCDWTYNEFRH